MLKQNWLLESTSLPNSPSDDHQIKATTGVCEAHHHQAYKPCAIGAMPWECMFLVCFEGDIEWLVHLKICAIISRQ